MKIALLIDSLGSGGAQRQIINLAIELTARGHNVSLITYHRDDFYLHLMNNSEVTLVNVESSNILQRIVRVKKTISKMHPDVLISFMDVPNLIAALSSIGKHRWKLIISDRIANETRFLGKKTRFIRYIQARRADVIACNSQSAADLWRKHFPKYNSKLKTIYNIIEVPTIEAMPTNDGKCRMVIAARYEREKNLQGMLQAVNLLSEEEKTKLEIHWYGKSNVAGAAESVLGRGEEFIKQNNLENCVFLHPATDKIYPIMAEADFIALFSFMEGLPNAIIEGMSLKKPVVMSKVSDYAVLVDEHNGFLCDPRSPESMVHALQQAINTTTEQRSEMGQKSYEKIKEICSREAVISQWETLINT